MPRLPLSPPLLRGNVLRLLVTRQQQTKLGLSLSNTTVARARFCFNSAIHRLLPHSASSCVCVFSRIHCMCMDWTASVRREPNTPPQSSHTKPCHPLIVRLQVQHDIASNTMTSSGSVHPARHQSPLVVGGQRRRRITRRPQMPRPNTAPALIPESVSLQDGLGARTTDRTTDQTELSIAPSSSEPFPSMISSMPNRSPAPSIGSTPSVAWEGKKKHGMFGLKTKDIGRPKSSHGSPHQLSPLPPLTPVKAAQVLGVDSSASRPRSSSLGSRVQNSDKCDGLLVGPILKSKLLCLY